MTMDGPGRLAAAARSAFDESIGGDCSVAYAPGRVNLIGEHTDYNDGFALPMAIDRGIAVAFRARTDRRLIVRSSMFAETADVALDDLDAVDRGSWFAYVAGTAWAMRPCDVDLPGADFFIHADLPAGAGLSSSAALEVAVARALTELVGGSWNPDDAARVAQRAENLFVGVACGIMDQYAAAASQAGHATLLDCRSLSAAAVRIPDEVAVVVMDSGARRRVASTEYASRRAACERAAAALRARHPTLRALRDATVAMLDAAAQDLDDETYARARHVIDENARVLAFVDALARRDLIAAGRLVNASHESLRSLFEVSGPELDRIVDAARRHPACLGARMTGAGFGGCAIALVSTPHAAAFIEAMAASADGEGACFISHPAAGARIL
jgi:galactokinase